MEKLLVRIAVFALLMAPATGISSFIIELNTGAKFVTDHYWESGGLVKFYALGGVIGFEKKSIRKITNTGPSHHAQAPSASSAPMASGTKRHENPPGRNNETTAGSPDDYSDAIVFREEKQLLTESINRTAAAFRNARVENRPGRMREERKKLLSLKAELSKLAEKVKAASGGKLPDWWDQPPSSLQPTSFSSFDKN